MTWRRVDSEIVDASDLAILKAMSNHRVGLWGGVDPRVSSSDVADRVDLHPSTVRARMRAWRDSGFLRGYDVQVNPRLFGAKLMIASVRVDDPTKKDPFLEELSLVEGAVGALVNVGPWVSAALVVEHPDAVDRRAKLLAKLPGATHVQEPWTTRLPVPSVDPTQLDWRIIRAVREGPDDELSEIADRVGVTPKTLTRRYRALLDGNAIWTVAVLDFRNYTDGVPCRLNLYVDDPDLYGPVRDAVLDAYPDALETNPPPPRDDDAPRRSDRIVEFLLHLPSAARVDEVLQTGSGIEGVDDAEILFPRGYRPYRDWYDERVDKACAGDL